MNLTSTGCNLNGLATFFYHDALSQPPIRLYLLIKVVQDNAGLELDRLRKDLVVLGHEGAKLLVYFGSL